MPRRRTSTAPCSPNRRATQVIALAAEVVGRLPADEVPAPLRAIARFAPAKRQRLGGAALAAALDGDEGFRASVAATVAETSPGLTARGARGRIHGGGRPGRRRRRRLPHPARRLAATCWPRPTGASRPNAAPSTGRGPSSTRCGPSSPSCAAAARGEAARLREAVASAGAQAETELADLRRALRERTRELRAGRTRPRRRDRQPPPRRRPSWRPGPAPTTPSCAALRGRLAEAERAAEAARRGARSERDVDDARLWLLVDTLVQAATGVRRELSLAPPTLRPADTVAAGGATDASARRRDRRRRRWTGCSRCPTSTSSSTATT